MLSIGDASLAVRQGCGKPNSKAVRLVVHAEITRQGWLIGAQMLVRPDMKDPLDA
jgi:hypothetical protein